MKILRLMSVLLFVLLFGEVVMSARPPLVALGGVLRPNMIVTCGEGMTDTSCGTDASASGKKTDVLTESMSCFFPYSVI